MNVFAAIGKAALSGRRAAGLVVALAVLGSGSVIALSGSARVDNDPTASLPAAAQSTQAAQLQKKLPSGQVKSAIVIYSRSGAALTAADQRTIGDQRHALEGLALGGQVSPLVPSADRTAALVSVPLAGNVDSSRTDSAVKAIRRVTRSGLTPGLLAQVTGGAAFKADIDNAFSGANFILLLTTVVVVAVLLLVTYRSPILWLIPLTAVAVADQVAGGFISILSRHTTTSFGPATTGIVEVLVFGAGTDYALLLVARYREELRVVPDRYQAMRNALGAAGPAIAASGMTVILALLSLLVAVLGDDVALGIAGAIGIATALLFGLVVLPAALAVLPRAVFWPQIPRADARGRLANQTAGRTWRRIGELTGRRPWPVIVVSSALLLLLAFGLAGTRLGLSQTETFRTRAESVAGLKTLARSFPAGAAGPVAVMTTPAAAEAVAAAAGQVRGVASARVGEQTAAIAEVDVVLAAAPGTPESFAAVRALRSAVGGVAGAHAIVGGTVAIELDTKTAAIRDLFVIAPLILAVVVIVLVLLLRALVAPVVLIASVILSFFAALGAGSWSFTHVFGFAGMDNQVPLLSFLFLVALGVDYNIFLVSRTREEAARVGTGAGVVNALAATGGVITSAGILLAAVFTVLGVLPVIVLTEIGVIVGIGVLLDTLLVRTILVPAIIQVLEERFWWPGRGPADMTTRAAADSSRIPSPGVVPTVT
ncbi:MAG: MMPL family transporter [Candidatus Dormiibacterota bacterium]